MLSHSLLLKRTFDVHFNGVDVQAVSSSSWRADITAFYTGHGEGPGQWHAHVANAESTRMASNPYQMALCAQNPKRKPKKNNT